MAGECKQRKACLECLRSVMATVHQDCSFALRELLLLTNLPRYFQISFPRKQEGSPKGALSSNHSHIGLLSKNKQKGKGKWLSRVRLFVTQSLEFPRPEYWSGQLFPSPGDLPNPGIKPRSPTLQADSLPAEPQGKPPKSKTSSCYHDILTDIYTHTHSFIHSNIVLARKFTGFSTRLYGDI